MASNELNVTTGINEKHASTMEDEIQQSTKLEETSESGKLDVQTKTKVEECSDTSDDRPRGNEEIEDGTPAATKTELEYPTGIRFVLLTISLMLGTYMVALDTSIICKPINFHSLKRPN
jgi:hypothetical protein